VRKINILQLVSLFVCLLFTGILIYLQPNPVQVSHLLPLRQSMANFGDWTLIGERPLDLRIIDELKLDDYVYQGYSQGNQEVDLYVGYYYSSSKVGAAHDPLVCFPGQGWLLSDKKFGTLNLSNMSVGQLDYSQVVASKEGESLLVIYWFQAGLETASNTFEQKFFTLKNKLFEQRSNNAFVRISTPLKNISIKEGELLLRQFVVNFYPEFYNYLQN